MRPTMKRPASGNCNRLRLSRSVRVREPPPAQSTTTTAAPAAKNMSAHVWTVPKASVESTSARHSTSMMQRLASVRGSLARGRVGVGAVGAGGVVVAMLTCGALVEALEIEVVIPNFAEDRAQGLHPRRARQPHDDRVSLRARGEV